MANSKATKRALLSSAVSLLLCFTMLMGATFAWFTDNVSSTGNRIQAGTLEVDLVMDKAKTGDYVSIAEPENDKARGDIFSEATGNGINWEPGKTEIVYLGVRNNGSLALKYNILLDVIDGGLIGSLEYAILDGVKAADLEGVEDWATIKAQAEVKDVEEGRFTAAENGVLDEIVNGVPEETDYFALAVHMKEEAGNEYQGDSITIDVKVLATQKDAEEDSFGSEYDKDAQHPTIVNTFADMIEVCKTGGSMVLENDISYTAENTEMMIGGSIFLINGKDVKLDLNGHNITIEEDATKVYGSIFFVGNPGGHINIVGDGEIIVKNGLATVVWTLQSGTANIYGGTYTSNSVSNEAMFYSQGNGGVINVYGGKYTYDLDRHLNGGFNVSDQAGNALRIILHEGVLLSRPEYSQHLQGTTNGEENRIKLAEGCTIQEVVIDGETWYQVVKG